MNRAQTYPVPKGTGKTENGFTKKESQPLAPAPRPLPEGELIISFYDSTKTLLSTEILSLKSENKWETLAFSAKAEEKGFVSASIRGTSSEPAKFDDFSIQLKSVYSAKLYQENHYYPFGMNMKGLESSDKQTQQNKKEHEFQFNAQTEREESFGLFWDETPFRSMDMQIGRFWGVDLLSEIYPTLSPFQYAFNNPIGFNDPTGLVGEGTEVEQSEEQAWYSREMIPSASQSAGVDTPTGGGADLVTDPGTGSGGSPDDFVFDTKGNYIRTDKTNLPDRVVLEGAGGQVIATYDFNDPTEDSKAIRNGVINNIVFISSYQVRNEMNANGVMQNRHSPWTYIERESRPIYTSSLLSGESMGMLDAGGGGAQTINMPTNSLFIVLKLRRGYNALDFGNFLWGHSGKQLGFSFATLSAAAHGNNAVNGRSDNSSIEWQLFDTEGDQRAIRYGYHFPLDYRAYKKLFTPTPRQIGRNLNGTPKF